MSPSSSSFSSIYFMPLAFLLVARIASAQLSSSFYAKTCPNALPTIQTAVKAAVANESRMGASLLRLHFHDCFPNASFPLTPFQSTMPFNISLSCYYLTRTCNCELARDVTRLFCWMTPQTSPERRRQALMPIPLEGLM